MSANPIQVRVKEGSVVQVRILTGGPGPPGQDATGIYGDPVTIAHGGTGVATAPAARAALDVEQAGVAAGLVTTETNARVAADSAETTARTNADNLRILSSEKGAANGVTPLGPDSKIADGYIPDSIARDAEVDTKVAQAISDLVAGAPGALNTLKELADAINDDASFAASVTTALAGKVPTTRTVGAGTGLSGGGALSANVVLAIVYGTSAGSACQGNDVRLSDARTPTAHKVSHQPGGSDELALAASQVASGTFVQARLGSGSGGAGTKVLLDNQTFGPPPADPLLQVLLRQQYK